MARIRKHWTYADTRAELTGRKDARRGASEDEFWDEQELVDYRPSRKKKRKARSACPETGNKHVWVWVDWCPPSRYEIKVCCGCLKKSYGRKSFRVKA